MSINKNIFRGFIIYPLGDFIAQIILNEFNYFRIINLAIIGGFLYSYEINKYFTFIEKKCKNQYYKTLLAVIFFNPIWITRHFLIIEFSVNPHNLISIDKIWEITYKSFISANNSFLASLFFTIIANYIIQNKINLKYRFLSSAVFSAIMNVYYAISKIYF